MSFVSLPSVWVDGLVPKPFDSAKRLVAAPDGSIHLADKHDKPIVRVPMATAHELLKGMTFLAGGIVDSVAYGVGDCFGATAHYAEGIHGQGYGVDGPADGSGRSK